MFFFVILSIISNIIICIFGVVFLYVFSLFKNDYQFDDYEKINKVMTLFFIINDFFFFYRIIYVGFIFLLLILSILVSELVFYFFFLCCGIERDSCSNFNFNFKRVLRNKFFFNTLFGIGSIDIFLIFFCFQNCMPRWVDLVQLWLDIFGLVIDFSLLFIAFGLGVLFDTKRKRRGNIAPVVVIYLQCLFLLVIILIDISRYIRNRNVNARVRHIFVEEGSIAGEVFYEDSIGTKECPFGDDCENTYLKHRVKCHKKNEVFKLKNFDEYNNIVVGFHQTSIENIKQIIKSTSINRSSEDWMKEGIYFATNFEATENKANNKGATFVAKINLGKVEELNVRPSTRSANQIAYGYETRYFHHDNGPKYDEFIIRNSTQILEYVIVVSKSEVI